MEGPRCSGVPNIQLDDPAVERRFLCNDRDDCRATVRPSAPGPGGGGSDAFRSENFSDCYPAGARPSTTPASACVSCLSSISSKVRPLGSNPNAQNPITPR